MKYHSKLIYLIVLIINAFALMHIWPFIFINNNLSSNFLLLLLVVIITMHHCTVKLSSFVMELLFCNWSLKKAFLLRNVHREIEYFQKKIKKLLNLNNQIEKNCFNDIKNILTEFELYLINKKIDTKKICSNLNQINIKYKYLCKENSQYNLVKTLKSYATMIIVVIITRFFLIEAFQVPSGSMIPTILIGDQIFVYKLSYGIPNPFSSTKPYLLRWAIPKPGDVMIFKAPEYVQKNITQTWIKRVIAGPGQKIKIKHSVIFVDEKPYNWVSKNYATSYLDCFAKNNKYHKNYALAVKEQITQQLSHTIYVNEISGSWPMVNQLKLPGLICENDSCLVENGYIFVMGDNRNSSFDSRWWGALPINNVRGKAVIIWMSLDNGIDYFKLGTFSMPSFRVNRFFKTIY